MTAVVTESRPASCHRCLASCMASSLSHCPGLQLATRYRLCAQVLERANDNEWGLACGVFAKDINVINTLSRGLKAGTVWVNTWNM